MKNHRLIPLILAVATSAHAGPRTSANYSIVTDTVDAGGARATSASYSNSGSAGGMIGISTGGGSAETAKSGYIGQLVDLAPGIFLTATPLTINEGGSVQIAAARNLDDGTGLALDSATVAWSILGGPIVGITAGGVATAGTVYQDTPASVQGIASGFTASLNLTVINVNSDDFGAYAGDGIDDAWQNLYFGLNNPAASPNADADGTGQTNLFKYIAGLNPIDPSSRFVLKVTPVANQPAQRNIVFSPLVPGRNYLVTFKTDLTAPTWQPLAPFTFSISDIGTTRTVTDLSTTAQRRFYHVEITKP